MWKREISSRYLSEGERVRIGDLRRQGLSVRAIAREVGRSPATVSRELGRNADADSGQHRPLVADRLAAVRRRRPGRGKVISDSVLREFVAGLPLEEHFLPLGGERSVDRAAGVRQFTAHRGVPLLSNSRTHVSSSPRAARNSATSSG